MGSVEGRVAFLEGRVEGHTDMINDIQETAARLDARFDQLETRLDQRFAAIDQRFAAVDLRFSGLDARLDSMNKLLWGVLIATTGGAVSIIAGIIAALFR